MNTAHPTRQPVIVEIYIADHCTICEYTQEVAAMIRAEFPTVKLRLITLGAPNVTVPDTVFATPTYLLNGQRWSLGNPSPEQVRAGLTEALADARQG